MSSTIVAPMQIQTTEGLLRSFLCLSIFGLLILIGEYLKRKKYITGEPARKFVHTTTGSWAALWPLFLDLKSIATLAIFLTLGAVVLRFFSPLKSIYSIRRLSIGEILIGIGIAISAWFSDSGSVYAAAVLIISWSDSVAAIVGTRYGNKNSFKIFNSKKSVFGSTAFFITTSAVIFGFYMYEHNIFSDFATMGALTAVIYSLGLSLFLTITEIFGIYGIDNLTVPILATVLLNLV